jgi:hypothetical protein
MLLALGTCLARYDDLFNGKDEKIDVSRVDVSMNGIELQDREFFARFAKPAKRTRASPRCCRAIRCSMGWRDSSTPIETERHAGLMPRSPVVSGPKTWLR